jgi:hypothetical protein
VLRKTHKGFPGAPGLSGKAAENGHSFCRSADEGCAFVGAISGLRYLANNKFKASPTMSSLNEGQLRRARGRHGIMAIRNCATARRSAGREAGKRIAQLWTMGHAVPRSGTMGRPLSPRPATIDPVPAFFS